MKLVTTGKNWSEMASEYVPGKCNLGRRGRAMRLTTGIALIALSIVLGLIVIGQTVRLVRLVAVFPFYVGLLAVLEGSMSFCVLHASRGTFDMSEPMGFASSRSRSMGRVESEDWKKIDRRKALRMHFEAMTGAIVLAVLLALA
jgi:hypothetical protein